MYSGTTLRTHSGRIMGVHQKIDRIARRRLTRFIPRSIKFPAIKDILHFEGDNGPDGIKRKSPSKDEPWHHINPAKTQGSPLVETIHNHILNLGEALKKDDQTRAAFEAAWLAHTAVDGLTPAHHYPLNDKIEELWGKPHSERITFRDKTIIRGKNWRDTLSKNWQYWGSGGVFTAHYMFEWGVATAILTHPFKKSGPSGNDIIRIQRDGFEALFYESLSRIYAMNMYNEFGKTGWTHDLADQTRRVLIPEIIKIVSLAWYQAILTVESDKK